MEFDIDNIRSLCSQGLIVLTEHMNKRMGQRGIVRDEIIQAIMNGEIIEEYPNDFPHPSCLILGCSLAGKYLHVVIGIDIVLYLITAYEPDPEVFPDMRTRAKEV